MTPKSSNNAHQKWCDLLTAVFTLCALDSRLKSRTLDQLVAGIKKQGNETLGGIKAESATHCGSGRTRTCYLSLATFY